MDSEHFQKNGFLCTKGKLELTNKIAHPALTLDICKTCNT